MAQAYITIGTVGSPSARETDAIVYVGNSFRTEAVTTSGTAQLTSITAQGSRQVASVFCDGAVFARAGGVASATTGLYIPAGQVQTFALNDGEAVSIVDVV